MALPHSNMLITYIKYKSGEKITLDVIKKNNASKRWHFKYYFEVPEGQMLHLLLSFSYNHFSYGIRYYY